MSVIKELYTFIKSGCSVINCISSEESRIKEFAPLLGRLLGMKVVLWNHIDGFTVVGEENEPSNRRQELKTSHSPIEALECIRSFHENALFIMFDFHHYWSSYSPYNIEVIRYLKILQSEFQSKQKACLICTSRREIPQDLEQEIKLYQLPLPHVDEITNLFNNYIQRIKPENVRLNKEQQKRLVRTMLGLTISQCRQILAQVLMEHRGFHPKSIDRMLSLKKAYFQEIGPLEFVHYTEKDAILVGYDRLKEWVESRRVAFTSVGSSYNLPAPKGLALVGYPGTGKSLAAKMIARQWQLPLLKLDMGAVFGAYIGQSEENLRNALRTVEVISPCILWIDEFEKSLGFNLSYAGDSGTSARVLSTLLTWMQEKKKPVFLVASTNNLEELPPEALRTGRFDTLFFMDLPNEHERLLIIRFHLEKRGLYFSKEVLIKLNFMMKDLSGAEIEQVVIESMFIACNEGGRKVAVQDIVKALKQITPIAKILGTSVQRHRDALRKGLYIPASYRKMKSTKKHRKSSNIVSLVVPTHHNKQF